jgi:hypothetical protein
MVFKYDNALKWLLSVLFIMGQLVVAMEQRVEKGLPAQSRSFYQQEPAAKETDFSMNFAAGATAGGVFLSSIVAHEYGHAAMALLSGAKNVRVTLHSLRPRCSYLLPYNALGSYLLIGLAGPVAQYAYAAALSQINRHVFHQDDPQHWSNESIRMAQLTAFLNLLPFGAQRMRLPEHAENLVKKHGLEGLCWKDGSDGAGVFNIMSSLCRLPNKVVAAVNNKWVGRSLQAAFMVQVMLDDKGRRVIGQIAKVAAKHISARLIERCALPAHAQATFEERLLALENV